MTGIESTTVCAPRQQSEIWWPHGDENEIASFFLEEAIWMPMEASELQPIKCLGEIANDVGGFFQSDGETNATRVQPLFHLNIDRNR